MFIRPLKTFIPDSYDPEGYEVVFERPLDPDDYSKGTFELHVSFCFTGYDVPNVFNCSGYGWETDIEYANEGLSGSYCQCNCISTEYRFFGHSAPYGLDYAGTDYWECLTLENAASDFHFVIEQFKTILTGKWCFTGGSKGGEATLFQSMYYPEDADVFYAISAPVKFSTEDPGIAQYLYEKIGDDMYGVVEAQNMRDSVLKLQVELIEHRDEYEEKFIEHEKKQHKKVIEAVEDEHLLYDVEVFMMGFGLWQQSSSVLFGYVYNIESIVEIASIEDEDERLESAFNLLCSVSDDPIKYTPYWSLYPYNIQDCTQTNIFQMDFSYIREELRKDGCEDALYVTEDMEETACARCMLTDEQFELFPYDPTANEELKKHLETTDCQIIATYGTADVWCGCAIDGIDNPNVHVYKFKGEGHECMRITSEMKDVLEKYYAPYDPISISYFDF